MSIAIYDTINRRVQAYLPYCLAALTLVCVCPPRALAQNGHSLNTLHTRAWKDNPNGAFVNWHPSVSCESFAGTETLK